MYPQSTETTVYAVATLMNSFGTAQRVTITPLPCMPERHARLEVFHCPEGVVHVAYFTRYRDAIRHLQGGNMRDHRVARAMIGLIEALAGLAS